MTDLEITRLCALAMGDIASELPDFPGKLYLRGANSYEYDPLTDDAQAMALVKRFELSSHSSRRWIDPNRVTVLWYVAHYNEDSAELEVSDLDLSRAICLCVAALQAGKEG